MGRLFLVLAVVLVCLAIVALSVSIWNSIARTAAIGSEGAVASNGIGKAAYIALIVVMFGLASGWLGGL